MTDSKRYALGRVVRSRRLALGLSQRDLAEASGLSVGMVRDLEQGRTHRPYPSTLRVLSQVLELDLQSGTTPRIHDDVPSTPGLHGTRLLILGVIEASASGVAVRLGSGKLRTLIAYLALNIGTVANRDTLIDLLWDERPPSNAEDRISEYVRKARDLLSPATKDKQRQAADVIERVGRGYRLIAQGCHRDADEFIRLSDHGRIALAAGRHSEAADTLEQALRLWRGDVMSDIEALKDLPQIARLHRRRSAAVQDIVAALSALDRRDDALAHLEAAVARDPFDEAMQGELLITLARCGRQAEALSRYQRFSELLIQELGVGPGPKLAEVHRRILRHDLEQSSSVAVRSQTVLRQLPAISPLFTGRDTEIRTIVDLLNNTADGQDFDTLPIVAIDGMAGVGKTAFAVRVGHHLADRFPDGQLYVDLHGFSAEPPRRANQVLEELLPALGVPVALIPADPEARAALYRDRLAGTRTLIVLDNAATADQVRPLLPSSATCLVLVTSRRRLRALDEALPLGLDALRDEDAQHLLTQMTPRSSEARHAESLRDLVSLCGKLPLALRIVGALLRQRPWLTPAVVADRLRNGLSGPNPLSIFDDGDRSLQSIFDLSFQTLRQRHQDMFRVLGVMPGPDIDAYGAAALANADVYSAEGLLLDLVDHNLLIESAPGRFKFHDLIRPYAGVQGADLSASDSAAATARLLEYFDSTAAYADMALNQSGIQASSNPKSAITAAGRSFESREQATDWMHQNAPNLLAAAHIAAGAGDHQRVASLAASLFGYLRTHGSWSDALVLLELAITSADNDGDLVTSAVARTRLGVIQRLLGDLSGSVAALQDALKRLQSNRDLPELVTVYRELGETYRLNGDYEYAEEALRAALAHRTLANDPLGRAGTLTSLGTLALISGAHDPLASIQVLEEAAEIYRNIGDRAGMVTALMYLGDIHRILGNYAETRRVLDTALEDARCIDDPLVQANVLVRLGNQRFLMDEREAADQSFRTALDIYLQLGSLIGEANTLLYLGAIQADVGEHANAVEILSRAQKIYISLSNERGQAMVRMYAAQAMHDGGNQAEAAQSLAQAISAFRASNDTPNEARALTLKGDFAMKDDAFGEAMSYYHRGLALAQQSRRRATEAIAWRGMGMAALAARDLAKATEYLENALQIYRSIDSPTAKAVEMELEQSRILTETL